uniref:sphingosine N-acyltransferase n=1 Tax=Bos taurus TaxID=9913 RepID=A0A3Q1MR56_BOVIN
MWSSLNDWLWNERLWLPANISWAQLEDHDGLVFPHPQDTLMAVPLALALVVVRFTFERFVALPLSRWLGVRNQIRRPADPNATLEKHYLMKGREPTESQMNLLATQCGLTLRQTQCWFRRRRNQDRPCLTKKFCESSWKFVFYLCCFVCGTMVLYHESWLWTPVKCWENYPHQVKPWHLREPPSVIPAVTLPLTQDFKEQVIHHFVTIILISFSYSLNLLRIGSLVLLLHDSADYLLEASKLFNYMHWRRMCDTLFIIFSLVFFYTRLVLFPTRILYTTFFESIGNFSPFFGYYFLNILLVILQLLHVFWSWLILCMIYSFIKKGQMEKDVRSDVEELDSSDGEAAEECPQMKNGAAQRPGAAPTDGPRSRAAGRMVNRHTPAT